MLGDTLDIIVLEQFLRGRISQMALPGLQTALDQMDGQWLRKALGANMELGIYEFVYVLWLEN